MSLPEREQVKQKVIKLLNMRTDNGASEQEALMALDRASKLMAHYDIELTELQLRSTKAVKRDVPFDKIYQHTLGSACFVAIGELCDCIMYRCPSEGCYVFFGLPEDTEFAAYLMQIVTQALHSELARFKVTNAMYINTPGSAKRRLGLSFLLGMEHRISERVDIMTLDKKTHIEKETTGRSLVPMKMAQVEDEFKDLGVKLTNVRSSKRRISSAAYSEGMERGNAVNLNGGINEQGFSKIAGL